MAANQWAGGLDAIRDAIGFYMDLRQQKYDRDRMAQSDARADRQLRMQEENALADNRRAEDESFRQKVQFQATNFGGSVLPESDANQWRDKGYGAMLEPEMTLPSQNPAAPAGPAPRLGRDGFPLDIPSPMNTIASRSDAAPTGRTRIGVGESERGRIAYYNAATRSQDQALNRASREAISNNTLALRKQQIEGMLSNQQVANSLRRYGIDTADVTRRQQLAELMAWRSASVDNMSWDNMFAGGPMALMRFMTPEGLQMPQNQPLQYNPQPPLTGGGSDWEIVP